MTLVSGNINRL